MIENLFFRERAKAFVNTISYRKNNNIEKDIRQHLKNAKEVDQVLKQKTKNDILAKEKK